MLNLQDLRYALRLLARSPGFTLLTIAVLAGGLAISIFTFAFLYTAMVKPLPVPDGSKIVRLEAIGPGGSSGGIDAADLAALRPRITSLRDLGAYQSREAVVGEGVGSRAVGAVATEWNLFETVRVRPALGRGLRPEDMAPGAEPVVVLSDRTWRAVFGADPAIVGSRVALSGASTLVVGVMPRGFEFPVATDVWVPIRAEVLTLAARGSEAVGAFARLAPGTDASQAAAELTTLLASTRGDDPAADSLAGGPVAMTVQSFQMAQIGDQAPLVFLVLNLAAGLILLLACVNVTNLLLARANERSRESAVRLALGAPRSRLIMQSMWESGLLAMAGGVVATGLAVWALGLVDSWARSHLEGNLPFWWRWGFDRSVLLAAGAFVTVAIGALGGVVAFRSAATDVRGLLQESGPGAGGAREGRLTRALVVLQVATVSVLMFFGAMSFLVSHRVVHVDFGYDTRNLLTATLDLPAERYRTAEARGRFYEMLRDQLAAAQGVDGAMLTSPMASGFDSEGRFELPGRPEQAAGGTFVQALLGPLDPLGLGLREGRYFDAHDLPDAAPVAIVSASFAQRGWPGGSPIGRQLRLTGLGEAFDRTVVGVSDDVLLGNPLSRERSPVAVYVPLRQTGPAGARLVFRHRDAESGARAAFHLGLASLDPLLAPPVVTSYREMLQKTTLIARSVNGLFTGCFAFALLLAVSGTYGLMARSIVRRTREIGLRRALGASDQMIMGMLLGQGARQLAVGALVALPVTGGTAIGFAHFFPVSPVTACAIAVLVSMAITGVVLLATWFPTRRAIAMEPSVALWRE